MREPDSELLHDWLRHTASATPGAIAIVEEDRVTSFHELFEHAASLALRFTEQGIQKQDRIALVLSKTTDAIIAVFASLLAGAIYVPIHPRWPRERIESVLSECAARLVIECDGTSPRITDRSTGACIPWHAPMKPIAGLDSLPRLVLSDTALILFTSGSTGRPKGVVLSHSAVGTFVKWTAREFQIEASDRIACPSPLGFDLSTFDIFNMALCGATAVLVPDNIAWMPRFLTQFVREAQISCWYSVPSILTGMLQDGRFTAHQFPHLRLILFAGEVFPGPSLARLQAVVPNALCANLYGPTETNVVTWCRVPRGYDGLQPLPIGFPCPYAFAKLDAASGELLAGGDSLMNGYWHRPDETKRSFVTLEGRRYYRTGDRASIASDGSLLFAGRLDRQVKRRGFRIELGEIEAALLQHEDILEAAAVAIECEQKGAVITAFFRLSASGALTLAAAKAHLGRRLPPYMLPDHILYLDAIPKGNRGKIDYIALSRIAEGLNRGD